jgi:hypothetical protein
MRRRNFTCPHPLTFDNPQDAIVVHTTTLPSIMDELRDRAGEYVKNARSKNTQRAYRTDWRHFEEWC